METFKRQLFESIKKYVYEQEYIVLIGARQVGKTTLLQQLAQLLKNDQQQVYQITLEDPSVLAELNKHPENLFSFVQHSDTKIFVLIDEIQYLDNPSNFLKLLYDKYSTHLKLIVTGSSAFYIDSKFTDSLAGRKILFELYTLHFEEFLEFKNVNNQIKSELKAIQENPSYISLQRNQIQLLFDEYLTYGGYPAVVLANTVEKKIAKLKELFNSYIKRDVQESGVQNPDKFYQLFKILASQSGALVNVNELSKTLGISVTSVNHYLWVLQKCFHISMLKPFSKNIRKELTKMPKVYCNDIGLRNVILNQFQPISERLDKGELLENYVFTRLRNLYGNEELYFWRTADGNEIDFIIDSNKIHNAIEVKWNDTAFSVSKYKKFTEAYPEFTVTVCSYNFSEIKNSVLKL